MVTYARYSIDQQNPVGGGIAQEATKGEEIRVSPALIQPIWSGDVSAAVADAAVAAPVNGIVEVGGPEALPVDELNPLLRAHHQGPAQDRS
ncbi:hypothetical protein [Rhizobium leguminosarum]|uniref:hypothetical protein n=1 Tax=Rhizobium leguminosarum TaxID=384 RepID=UPI00103F85AC|nr:hypothetical protein E0H64_30055 [Rhizobium leguminosarum bv. viciae]TBZ75471.1 hypothetical protein E0H61_26290 [Rhizobium leguminosarum bv. viciae]